jgi:hypothetical protein
VTNNNGFWIEWLDLLALQLQLITTAHNQWLPKTRSIPCWTSSVFSSTVTDLVRIYESVTYESLRTSDEWRMRTHSRLNSLELTSSRRTEYRSLSQTNSWSITASCQLLRNVCQSRGNTLICTNVFIAAGTCLRNQPLPFYQRRNNESRIKQ